MGVTDSIPLDPVFELIAAWPWSKVRAALKAYADGEFDFCIDAETVSDITALSEAHSTRLVSVLSTEVGGKSVNALTLLISIVLVGDSAHSSIDIRLEALFDLMDFSSLSSITLEESTILLILISSAMACIMGQRGSAPSDKTLQRASGVIYEALDKIPTQPLMKSEFILWATSILDELPTNKLDTVFALVFIKGVGIAGNQSVNKKASPQMEEPDLPGFRREEQENEDFKGDLLPVETSCSGTLIVQSIKLLKFKGKEVFASVRVGDGSMWAQSTDIAQSGGAEGTEWTYDSDELSGLIDSSYLAKNVINLKVKDSNETTADKIVGKAKISTHEILESAGNNQSSWVTLSGQLLRHDEAEVTGEYIVKLKFVVPAGVNFAAATNLESVVDDEIQQE